MGKPKAPPPPDYAAAAAEQGKANLNSALGTNYLNQANQIDPYGSRTYSYDTTKGNRLPDGTIIPQTTATTTLSPTQQHLYDQQTGISTQLNDLASRGIGYVDKASSTPIDQNQLPTQVTSLDQTSGVGLRDKITNAMMERLQPQIERDRAALDTRLSNQGITHGSEAYNWDQTNFQKGVNDQRIAALLAGDQEQQSQFSRGLAGGQFTNQARGQAIQEADYFKNQPLNMLNALRSGNQTTLPQFGNVSAGSNIAAAPVYQATADQYSAAMQAYQAQLQARGALIGGLSSIAGAGTMAAFGGFGGRR